MSTNKADRICVLINETSHRIKCHENQNTHVLQSKATAWANSTNPHFHTHRDTKHRQLERIVVETVTGDIYECYELKTAFLHTHVEAARSKSAKIVINASVSH